MYLTFVFNLFCIIIMEYTVAKALVDELERFYGDSPSKLWVDNVDKTKFPLISQLKSVKEQKSLQQEIEKARAHLAELEKQNKLLNPPQQQQHLCDKACKKCGSWSRD